MERDERRLLDEALARLRVLEDERAILRTLYRYGHAIDYGQEQEWLDCFTDTAVFDVRRRNEPDAPAVRLGTRHEHGVRWQGRAALAAFIAGHTRAPDKYHKHLLIEPAIELDGDQARVQSYFVRLDEADGAPYLYVYGRYLDRLMRCADGMWRFTERVCEVEATQPGVPQWSTRA